MDIIEAIMARRSVRDFSPRAVPKRDRDQNPGGSYQEPVGRECAAMGGIVAAGETVERIRKAYKNSAGRAFHRDPAVQRWRPLLRSCSVQAGVIEGLARLAGLDPPTRSGSG